MFTINTECYITLGIYCQANVTLSRWARVNAIIKWAKHKLQKPLNVDKVSLDKVLLVLCRIILQLTVYVSLGLTLLAGSLVSLDVAWQPGTGHHQNIETQSDKTRADQAGPGRVVHIWKLTPVHPIRVRVTLHLTRGYKTPGAGSVVCVWGDQYLGVSGDWICWVIVRILSALSRIEGMRVLSGVDGAIIHYLWRDGSMG